MLSTLATHGLHWSPAEKSVARKAFEHALKAELEETVRNVKARVAKVTEASELWDLEQWLGKRRKEIDNQYDYRYSVLPEVFAVLIHQKRLALEDLQGLGEDKLDIIRRYLALTRRD